VNSATITPSLHTGNDEEEDEEEEDRRRRRRRRNTLQGFDCH